MNQFSTLHPNCSFHKHYIGQISGHLAGITIQYLMDSSIGEKRNVDKQGNHWLVVNSYSQVPFDGLSYSDVHTLCGGSS